MDQLYLSETPILFRNDLHHIKVKCELLNINTISDEWIKEKQSYAFETCLCRDYTYSYLKKGIIGEMGEVFDVIKKYERGDFETDIAAFENVIVKELGDVLWYILVLHKWIEENITERSIMPYYPLTTKQHHPTLVCCNNVDFFLDALHTQVVLFFNTGKPKPILCLIQYFASLMEKTLDDIQQINYDKLKDRVQRNVIKGSGNHR